MLRRGTPVFFFFIIPHHAKRVSLCLINVHNVQCPALHRHWSWISFAHLFTVFPVSKINFEAELRPVSGRLGGRPSCHRQHSLYVTRSLIGPTSWPISSRRGSPKTPPRTRAECTQESEAVPSCCTSETLGGDMWGSALIPIEYGWKKAGKALKYEVSAF